MKLQVWLYKAYHEPVFRVRIKMFINPFSTNGPLLFSQKTSENLLFSDVFRGYEWIQVEHWLQKFHDFHLLAFETTTEICSAK